jgi:hypothetical protein
MNPPPAGRLGQFNLLGDLRGGQFGVVLQQAQNLAIDGFEPLRHKNSKILIFIRLIMRSIVVKAGN